MKIGYPARNLSIGCTPAHTFRLASFTDERFMATVTLNLDCLVAILRYNAEHDVRFFRIGSDLIPFASHPVNTLAWWDVFAETLAEIGAFIREQNMRISMHPGQFTIINTPNDTLFATTAAELVYHARLLEAFGLDETSKLQLHVGGIYGDKSLSIQRFAERFVTLPANVQARVVVENDDRLFSVADCCRLYDLIGIPMVFDNLHHKLLNEGEPLAEAFASARATWQDVGVIPMMDYSDQAPDARPGKHAEHIDAEAFAAFLSEAGDADYDIMLELKDKESSALDALQVARMNAPERITAAS